MLPLFEYHTFLHHSQTNMLGFTITLSVWVPYIFTSFSNLQCVRYQDDQCLSTIHFYIILKHIVCIVYYQHCLSTIHFYIILKLSPCSPLKPQSLSTIHFYIILKRKEYMRENGYRLSTIHFYIILKPQIQKWNAIIRIKYRYSNC